LLNINDLVVNGALMMVVADDDKACKAGAIEEKNQYHKN
jgi:hypothetical protein